MQKSDKTMVQIKPPSSRRPTSPPTQTSFIKSILFDDLNRHSKSPISWRRRMAIYAITLLVIVFIGILSFRSETTTATTSSRIISELPADSSTGSNSSMVHIDYILTEEDASMKRYAAFESVSTNDDDFLNRKPVTIRRWAELLSTDLTETLARDLTELIKSVPYKAFFFETKGASSSTSHKPFEFVLINSPSLHHFCDSNPDPNAFAEHLQCQSSTAGCSFPNLSGDATLIAPRPVRKDANVYSHLGAFLRYAPETQITEVWRLVAKEYGSALKRNRTVWLSTCGLGVAYLHFRLDLRPKYYSFGEFAKEV